MNLENTQARGDCVLIPRLLFRLKLHPQALELFGCIYPRGYRSGHVHLSREMLANEIGVGRHRLGTLLQRLEEVGLITVERLPCREMAKRAAQGHCCRIDINQAHPALQVRLYRDTVVGRIEWYASDMQKIEQDVLGPLKSLEYWNVSPREAIWAHRGWATFATRAATRYDESLWPLLFAAGIAARGHGYSDWIDDVVTEFGQAWPKLLLSAFGRLKARYRGAWGDEFIAGMGTILLSEIRKVRRLNDLRRRRDSASRRRQSPLSSKPAES